MRATKKIVPIPGTKPNVENTEGRVRTPAPVHATQIAKVVWNGDAPIIAKVV